MEKEGFFTRLTKATRYTISGITPDTWFSPLQPLEPFVPVTPARRYDYRVGRNVSYQPGGEKRYGFSQLRNAARASQLIRLAIETRKDQMEALAWCITAKGEEQSVDKDPRVKAISEFFSKPDGVHDWAGWLRIMMEEVLVTDALSLVPRRNYGGLIHSVEIVDGSTIFPLIDGDGRQPLPPSPAFQQILKNVVKNDYSSDELFYCVRNTQVNTPYGWSPVEQVIETAYTDIERAKYQFEWLRSGSVPDAYITAPDNMTPDRVKAFEEELNGLLEGNLQGRRQMPVLLHGMEVKQLKEPAIKSDWDEWIWRKIAFAFSLTPAPMVKEVNRATAESEMERATNEGIMPLMLFTKRIIDRIIATQFGAPDLHWKWDVEEERDPTETANIDKTLVSAGIMTINEIRSERGLEPVEGGDMAMCLTASGYVPVDPAAATALMQERRPMQPEIGENEDIDGVQEKEEEEAQPKGEKFSKKKSVGRNIYMNHGHAIPATKRL